MEEIINNGTMELTEVEGTDLGDCTEGSGANILAKVLCGVIAGVAVGGATVYAKRNKLKEWRTKRWLKRCPAGYRVDEIPADDTANDKLPKKEASSQVKACEKRN